MPVLKICIKSGCVDLAVRDARSDDYCRGHYRSVVLADVEMVPFLVTAPTTPRGKRPGIVDARTGETVYVGGVAELDPQATNINALIAAGLGRIAVATDVEDD